MVPLLLNYYDPTVVWHTLCVVNKVWVDSLLWMDGWMGGW